MSGTIFLVRNKESEDGAASGRNTSLESQEPVVDADDTDGAAVAPRVKLAADGTIILDEERYVTSTVQLVFFLEIIA